MDGHIFTLICCNNCIVSLFEKPENKRKRDQGNPLKTFSSKVIIMNSRKSFDLWPRQIFFVNKNDRTEQKRKYDFWVGISWKKISQEARLGTIWKRPVWIYLIALFCFGLCFCCCCCLWSQEERERDMKEKKIDTFKKEKSRRRERENDRQVKKTKRAVWPDEGDFFKVLWDKFSFKVAQIFADLLGCFEKFHFLVKSVVATFGPMFFGGKELLFILSFGHTGRETIAM